MEALISLIVPVYNGEKWIKQFFRQFEDQTYNNLELILVDDGSTDTTPLLLDDYSYKKDNVFVYHKRKGGYIAFADIDDRFILHIWNI